MRSSDPLTDPLAVQTAGIDRRALLRSAAAAGVAGVVPLSQTAVWTGHRVGMLRVNNRVDPLAVEERAPRLSWQTHGFSQTGYRVRVASRPDRLALGVSDLWDSGDVTGSTVFDVRYLGRALGSAESAFWQVESWDSTGRRTSSPVASWRAGLLRPTDWQGKWLAAEHVDIAGDRDGSATLSRHAEPGGLSDGSARSQPDIPVCHDLPFYVERTPLTQSGWTRRGT